MCNRVSGDCSERTGGATTTLDAVRAGGHDMSMLTRLTAFGGAALASLAFGPIVAAAIAPGLSLLDQPGGMHVQARSRSPALESAQL